MNDPLASHRLGVSSKVPVTFIVTSYNKADYLRAVLTSVWREVCATKGQMILVDDGSSDGSLNICAEFARQHPSVIFRQHANKGIFRTLNSVIALADGKWVRFCDSDDPLILGSTERLISIAETMNAPISYGKAITYGPEPLSDETVQDQALEGTSKTGSHPDGALYLLRRMGFTPSRAVYRRSNLARSFPLPEDLVSCQDLAISLTPALDGPIAWLDEPVCFYLSGVTNQLAANRVLMWHQILRIIQYYGPSLQEHHRRAAITKAVHRATRFTRQSPIGLSQIFTRLWLLGIRASIRFGKCDFEKTLDKIARLYEPVLEPIIKDEQRVY